ALERGGKDGRRAHQAGVCSAVRPNADEGGTDSGAGLPEGVVVGAIRAGAAGDGRVRDDGVTWIRRGRAVELLTCGRGQSWPAAGSPSLCPALSGPVVRSVRGVAPRRSLAAHTAAAAPRSES